MTGTAVRPVLVGGCWVPAQQIGTFASVNPHTGEDLWHFPLSSWADVNRALNEGVEAYRGMQEAGPSVIASFLDRFANRLEDDAEALCAVAARETALAEQARLRDVELPRTVNQMRQAAAAARDRDWMMPVLSPGSRIAARLAPIPGVAVVFGPNNFPFAFNSVTGGDAVAAFATGHPVLAKANPGHPETTRLLAEHARAAAGDAGLPATVVQLLYGCSPEDGLRLVADARIACTAFTGSYRAGVGLKAAADKAGKPIYLEMSSVNPVVVLPGAWQERGSALSDELAASILQGTGQFCTNPGLLLAVGSSTAAGLRDGLAARLGQSPAGTLLGRGVAEHLRTAQRGLVSAGATVLARGPEGAGHCSEPNVLFEVDASSFCRNPGALAQEAFGNCSLLVTCRDVDEAVACLRLMDGSLTGSVYLAETEQDGDLYRVLEPVLRERVGRLINNKPPTGVAVDPAMNHGGPYPASGHPGFTAVGIPASLRRFGMLQSYDNVPDLRLPAELQSSNPLGLQRCVDGVWTTSPVTW
jgi:NADP-dependent aldehyde dehydrogenase